MRLHLPALLALVSATSYAACGSSDESRTDHEAGASGEGGDASHAAGSQNGAGTSNVAGTKNGAGGDSSAAGAPPALGGEGGVAGSVLGGAGGAAGGEPVGGEAGSAGAPTETGLPAACPGVLGDYTLLEGGVEPDTFTNQQLNGKVLARGLEGDDLFETNTGQDCLVGGPGDDDFTSASEGVSYLVGGPGADAFHLAVTANNYTRIADMTAEDTIGLSKTAFYFLAGTVGGTPYDTQVYSIVGYEAGTGLVPSAEGAAIVYDPATGGLWQDSDRGDNTSGATQIATILNAAGYTYDIDDFILDD
jgi:hypothetical protein